MTTIMATLTMQNMDLHFLFPLSSDGTAVNSIESDWVEMKSIVFSVRSGLRKVGDSFLVVSLLKSDFKGMRS